MMKMIKRLIALNSCERIAVYTIESWLTTIQLSAVDGENLSKVYLESTKMMKMFKCFSDCG